MNRYRVPVIELYRINCIINRLYDYIIIYTVYDYI